MPDPMSRLSTRFLRTPEAARYLSLSGRTLEKHRTYGTGPAYRKIGGRVIYALEDLRAWADLGTKTSTSDPGRGLCCRLRSAQCCAPTQARNIADSRTKPRQCRTRCGGMYTMASSD
ncbi:putative DNA-binding transcriptional regulator AlpA [Bradyrhizobium sp. USDA 3315]